jgi:hypothetical protein
MLNHWFALTMLLLESNEVAALRLAKFAEGEAIWDEAEIMISEKIGAGVEAFTSLSRGEDALNVINRYRELVAANYGRLNQIPVKC